MSKHLKFELVVLILLVMGWLFFHSKTITQPIESLNSQELTVRVVHPQKTDVLEPLAFSARIYPIESALIFSRANGFVQERFVDIGDHVTQGQLLARLSSPELEEQIKQAQAQIQLQEATIKLALLEYQRVQTLVDKGAVSRSQYDQKDAEYKVAMATLELNKAQLGRLKREFDYTEIKAPFNGYISQRNIDKGDRISSTDSTSMFKLIRTNELRVVVDVPQSQLFSIKNNAFAYISFPELPNQLFKGKFSRLSQEVDQNSGTMRVEFMLNNQNEALQAGLSGEVRIKLTEAEQFLLIPANALSVREGKSSVVLVDEQNKIKFQEVVTGRIRGNNVEILSGLGIKNNVVINPNALLSPGQSVKMVLITT